MRAVAVKRFGAEPELLQVPTPEPGPGELLVRVAYAALNPVDRQMADGAVDGRAAHEFPLVLGVDFAGRVEAVGTGKNRFRVGDPVFGQAMRPPVGAGTFAEYVAVPQDGPITVVPDGLDMRTAAMLPTAGMTAAQLLAVTALRTGQSLLVIGAAGGVGCCLTQLAAARGVQVVAVVRGDERRLMSGLGADVTVDSTAEDVAGAVRGVRPDGVDAVADLVSDGPGSFTGYAGLVRPGGLAVATRFAAGSVTLEGGAEAVGFRLHASSTLLDALAAAAADGELQTPVDAELPLEKAPEALARSRVEGARGKTVFAL
ncbi:NADP-dependent oxidoreductase [Streptomyces sp. NPDC002889]|uniref:NADP-dependent oxidoreductase n=1 Tax=Streptomyces sp. NPDC002889 TaxID=3364669 RepID=UPI00367DD9DB